MTTKRRPNLSQQLQTERKRRERAERKAARANIELARIQQENNRLQMKVSLQAGWLNAEGSYTRRHEALQARMNIIREVLRVDFPEKYGQPGAWNLFGDRPEDEGLARVAPRLNRRAE